MTARQQLVERWQDGLAENEQRLADGSGRFRWLRQVYRRIFRFLLATYGTSAWRADTAAQESPTSDDTSGSHMPFVDHTATATGQDPKSPARIRATLKSVHNANVPKLPGRQSQLLKQSWVTVAATNDRRIAKTMQKQLAASGISARRVWRTTDYAIEVPYYCFYEALQRIAGTPLHSTRRGYHLRFSPQFTVSMGLLGVTTVFATMCLFLSLIPNGGFFETPALVHVTLLIFFVVGCALVATTLDRG